MPSSKDAFTSKVELVLFHFFNKFVCILIRSDDIYGKMFRKTEQLEVNQ